MSVYKRYESEIRRWSAALGWWHSVLYGHAVCLRSAPLYSAFTTRDRWGDDECLTHARRMSSGFLFGEPAGSDAIDSAYSRLEAVIPDSESFPDRSAACDAGIIHLYTLSLLRRPDPQEAYYIASYCYNIVDAAAYADMLPVGNVTPEFESAIEDHRFVQREVKWQARGRELLSAVPEQDLAAARQFLDHWTQEPIIR